MNTTTETTAHDRILADRARYVSAGISTPKLVVSHADGARVTDVGGRTFIDFAGGIGCQNTGHRFAPVVDAIKAQADEYLHQCFMVGVYEPYVEVCRRLADLSPCAGEQQKSILVNSGAEAVENAVKIARSVTGRPAVVVFDNAFHGRTLLTMTMTAKVKPYKAGFGPFAPEVYRAPVPNPYRGITTDDAVAGLKQLFKAEVDPATVACAVLEPVQGEGGFLPMPADYLGRLLEICHEHGILYVDDEVQSGVGRTGKNVGDRALRGCRSGPARVGQVDRRGPAARRRHRSRLDHGRRASGGSRRHVRRQPALVRRGSGGARRGRRAGLSGAASALGDTMRARVDQLAARHPAIGEVRGLGPMLAFELAEQAPDRAAAIVAAAFERGLLLLACGMYGNVIRLLAPLTIDVDELEEGLTLLEESLDAAL